MTKKTTKKSATRKSPTKKASKPKPASKGKATRDHVVAQAKADQENARVRDERAASPDGMTASERAMTESAADAKRGKKKAKAAKEKKPKKLSLIDAAVQVLAESKEPMNCKQMVERVTAKKLWSSDAATPHATLYSAILRELQNKGKDARFKKVDRGQFTLAKKD
jgi:hypothetical protein